MQFYTTKEINENSVIVGKKILDLVRFAKRREAEDHIYNAAVRRNLSVKYLGSILTETDV